MEILKTTTATEAEAAAWAVEGATTERIGDRETVIPEEEGAVVVAVATIIMVTMMVVGTMDPLVTITKEILQRINVQWMIQMRPPGIVPLLILRQIVVMRRVRLKSSIIFFWLLDSQW